MVGRIWGSSSWTRPLNYKGPLYWFLLSWGVILTKQMVAQWWNREQIPRCCIGEYLTDKSPSHRVIKSKKIKKKERIYSDPLGTSPLDQKFYATWYTAKYHAWILITKFKHLVNLKKKEYTISVQILVPKYFYQDT